MEYPFKNIFEKGAETFSRLGEIEQNILTVFFSFRFIFKVMQTFPSLTWI